jgi:hypothetical protein
VCDSVIVVWRIRLFNCVSVLAITRTKVKNASTINLNICVHGEFMGVRSYNNFVMFFEFLLDEAI